MRVRIEGDIRAEVQAQVAAISAKLRRAVERAGRDVQSQLRAQVDAAGFKNGKAISNAWRLQVYPQGQVETLRPSALVFSRAPKVIEAFERGQEITAKGGRYLCWPTGFNAIGGRRQAGNRGGVRVTPEEMQARGGFLIPWGRGGGFLWCLRVRRGEQAGRRRKTRVFAGDLEVLTGNSAGREARAAGLLDRGFVPMFFLVRVVRPRKRLDVAGVAVRADGILAQHTIADLGL